jgi:hypothetical protein
VGIGFFNSDVRNIYIRFILFNLELKVMDECLLPIGSVVKVEDPDDVLCEFMIVGHRVVNPNTMRAWDYISVNYPEGLKRYFKSDKTHDYDDVFYFNHYEIEKVVSKFHLNQELGQSGQLDTLY